MLDRNTDIEFKNFEDKFYSLREPKFEKLFNLIENLLLGKENMTFELFTSTIRYYYYY